MDYGWTNDQHQLAIHSVWDNNIEAARKKLPKDYDAFRLHYEETEIDAARHYKLTGGHLVHRIPFEFGALDHPNPVNGKHYLRYDKGNEHGMDRPEDHGQYEAAKFNQRLNPRIDRVGNYKVHDSEVIRAEYDMKAGSLAHFPDVGGLVTSVSCS